MMAEEKRFAPEGYLWVCCACGKTAEDLYGLEGKYSYLWDESCMLNASLFSKEELIYDERGERVVGLKYRDEIADTKLDRHKL